MKVAQYISMIVDWLDFNLHWWVKGNKQRKQCWLWIYEMASETLLTKQQLKVISYFLKIHSKLCIINTVRWRTLSKTIKLIYLNYSDLEGLGEGYLKEKNVIYLKEKKICHLTISQTSPGMIWKSKQQAYNCYFGDIHGSVWIPSYFDFHLWIHQQIFPY